METLVREIIYAGPSRYTKMTDDDIEEIMKKADENDDG